MDRNIKEKIDNTIFGIGEPKSIHFSPRKCLKHTMSRSKYQSVDQPSKFSPNPTYHKHIKAIIVNEFSSIPSVIQMDPNQEPEQATHFPSMASSPTTASGTLSPYFRLNYSPSIPASFIFVSFSLHINSSSFPTPSSPSKRCRTLIHLTLLCSAYSSTFTLCPRPHLHGPFSGSQGTSISLTTTQ